jgi:pilus assembly protein FimV
MAAGAAAASAGVGSTVPASTQAQAAAGDLDLDLDFSIGDDEPAAPAPLAASSAPEPSASPVPVQPPMPSLDMDFGTDSPASEPPAAALGAIDLPLTASAEPTQIDMPDLALPDNAFDFDIEPPKPAPAPSLASTAPAPTSDPGMIEFDLGALSLDLGSPPAAAKSAPSSEPDTEVPSTAGAPLSTVGFEHSGSGDPLATKFALAQEFNAIGDPDGARSLAEEVVAEAKGDLKNKAQRFLAEIG